MSNRATSARIKIDRAKQHIRDLEYEIASLHTDGVYEVIQYSEPNDYGVSCFVRVKEDFIPLLAAIAADAVHNLQSALDHLWRAAINAPLDRARSDYFPCATKPDELKSRNWGKVGSRPHRAIEIIRKAGAFDYPNIFATIGKLDADDKHDRIRLVVPFLDGIAEIDASRQPHQTPPLRWAIIPDEGENGLYFLRDGVELYGEGATTEKLDVDFKLAIEIAFGVGWPMELEAVLPTLMHMAQMVDGIREAFDAAGLLDN